MPRYELLELSRYNRLSLQTARGCPLHCEFCAASRIFGGYKRKPIANVERELAAITRLWPTPFLELADDNTFVDKKWSRQLVEVLGRSGVPWFTETDVSVADDPRLLDLLAEANCRQLLIGFEAPTARELSGLDASGFKRRRADTGSRARVVDVRASSMPGALGAGALVGEELRGGVPRGACTARWRISRCARGLPHLPPLSGRLQGAAARVLRRRLHKRARLPAPTSMGLRLKALAAGLLLPLASACPGGDAAPGKNSVSGIINGTELVARSASAYKWTCGPNCAAEDQGHHLSILISESAQTCNPTARDPIFNTAGLPWEPGARAL
ncbi:MAG: radical SAM protein [Myxococcota bacterium]